MTLGEDRRAIALASLASQPFDVLVVGGGIVGASVAWHAALAGARVALVDRGDFAAATSSASSKLLHGGLRYLAMGDLRLVREAHRERWANADTIAPHLVHHQPFLLPIHHDGHLPAWKARLGVFAYGVLAGSRDGVAGRVSREEAERAVPALAVDGLRSVVRYYDHRASDTRLTLAVLAAAEAADAVIANHVEVIELRRDGSRVSGAVAIDRVAGEPIAVRARAIVNATGPWVDRLRRLETTDAGTSVQLSKGAHLVLRRDTDWAAAVTTPLAGGRVAFAVPFEEDLLLLGTTDAPYDGDPDAVTASDADAEQILREAGRSLVGDAIAAQRVRSRFAGLRALPATSGATASARREVVISRGPAGMVSVAGGKLTTWRVIGRRVALEALEIAAVAGRPPTAPVALPCAVDRAAATVSLLSADASRSAALVAHLVGAHGADASAILSIVATTPALGEPIVEGAPEILAELVWARDHRYAVDIEDALRRTSLPLRGLVGADTRDRVARALA